MKSFVTLILTLFTTFFLQASDSYNWHTTQEYQVKNEKGRLFLVKIARDPNGISIAEYKKVLLPNSIGKNAYFVSVTEGRGTNHLLIADDTWYYFVNSHIFYNSREKITPEKVFTVASVTKFSGSQNFLIDGVWYRVSYNPYDREQPIKKEPINSPVEQLSSPQKEKSSLLQKDWYYDGKNYYKEDKFYSNKWHRLKNKNYITLITHKKYTNKGRESYQHQLKPFVLVDNEIRYYEIDNRRNVFKARLVRCVPLTSEIKDLQLCFASKDKLLIEDKVIENICDFDTMTFVGSVVDVINPSGDWAEVE